MLTHPDNFPRPCALHCGQDKLKWASAGDIPSSKPQLHWYLKAVRIKKLDIGPQSFAGRKAIIAQMKKPMSKDTRDKSNALSLLVVQQGQETDLRVQPTDFSVGRWHSPVSWKYTEYTDLANQALHGELRELEQVGHSVSPLIKYRY